MIINTQKEIKMDIINFLAENLVFTLKKK